MVDMFFVVVIGIVAVKRASRGFIRSTIDAIADRVEFHDRITLNDGKGKATVWYRQGMNELLNTQQADGSWNSPNSMDGKPVMATSFALLYLANGEKLLD